MRFIRATRWSAADEIEWSVKEGYLGMVDKQWLRGFQQTVSDFDRRQMGGGHVVSIKVRIESGCFHREHSPEAYKIIDAQLRNPPRNVEAIEHESGPELLAYLGGALTLAGGIITLVTAIIQARSAGIRKGDHPREPLVLIVRRVGKQDDYHEHTVLQIGHTDKVDSGVIEDQLNASIRELFKYEQLALTEQSAGRPNVAPKSKGARRRPIGEPFSGSVPSVFAPTLASGAPMLAVKTTPPKAKKRKLVAHVGPSTSLQVKKTPPKAKKRKLVAQVGRITSPITAQPEEPKGRSAIRSDKSQARGKRSPVTKSQARGKR